MKHLTSSLFTAIVVLASCNSSESKVTAEKESYQKAQEREKEPGCLFICRQPG